MSINQRIKGHVYERNCANWYRNHGFPKAQRHLEYQTGESVYSTDLSGVLPFQVQCKKGSHVPLTLYKFIEQIKRRKGCYPTVHCKRDRKKSLVILYEEDFGELLDMLKTNAILRIITKDETN